MSCAVGPLIQRCCALRTYLVWIAARSDGTLDFFQQSMNGFSVSRGWTSRPRYREGARCEVALSLTLVYCALSCLSGRHTTFASFRCCASRDNLGATDTRPWCGARNTLTAIVLRTSVRFVVQHVHSRISYSPRKPRRYSYSQWVCTSILCLRCPV